MVNMSQALYDQTLMATKIERGSCIDIAMFKTQFTANIAVSVVPLQNKYMLSHH